jgi:hypothetical protein
MKTGLRCNLPQRASWSVMDEQGCAAVLRTGGLGRSFLRGWLGWVCHRYAAFAGSWRVRAAFCFALIRALIFLYWETQATLLMTMTAAASPMIESINMVWLLSRLGDSR